jgi:hypothetical protein
MAKFCGHCGNEMHGTRACGHCGWIDHNVHVQNVHERKGVSKGAAIGLAIIVLVACAGGFYAISKAHVAYIEVEVTSVHITEYVDVVIYIDGKYNSTWKDIPPGQTWHHLYYQKYHFSLFEGSKSISITAISYGGGLGSVTDSKTLVVEHGEKYTLRLYV